MTGASWAYCPENVLKHRLASLCIGENFLYRDGAEDEYLVERISSKRYDVIVNERRVVKVIGSTVAAAQQSVVEAITKGTR